MKYFIMFYNIVSDKMVIVCNELRKKDRLRIIY